MINVSTKRPESESLKYLLNIQIETFSDWDKIHPSDFFLPHFYDNGSDNYKNCVSIVMFKTDEDKAKFIQYLETNSLEKIRQMFTDKLFIKIK